MDVRQQSAVIVVIKLFIKYQYSTSLVNGVGEGKVVAFYNRVYHECQGAKDYETTKII